jgi:SRSO17 transposase
VVKRFDVSFDGYDPFFVTKTRASGSQARICLRGLMQVRRRNIERIRDAVPGADEQALHHFIANSPWDHRPVLDQVARDANALLGGSDDSFLLIDETGFPKKGRDFVGVVRQWCGRWERLTTVKSQYVPRWGCSFSHASVWRSAYLCSQPPTCR